MMHPRDTIALVRLPLYATDGVERHVLFDLCDLDTLHDGVQDGSTLILHNATHPYRLACSTTEAYTLLREQIRDGQRTLALNRRRDRQTVDVQVSGTASPETVQQIRDELIRGNRDTDGGLLK